MMRMRGMGKAGTAILAVMLAVGCSTGGGGNSEGSAQQGTGVKDEAVKLNKDAKIRIYGPLNGAVKGLEPGATLNDNQFINAIREKTGYKNLEYVQYDPATNDKLGLVFASGEQVDMLFGATMNNYSFLEAQGVLQPVDSFLSKAGPEILKTVPDTAWASVTADGKKMSIPVPYWQEYNGQAIAGTAVMVRQDIMDKHGLKAPKTAEELYTLLKTVKEKEPGMIPLVSNAGNGTDPFGGLGAILGAFGLSVPYEVKDGKLVTTDSLYLKDGLEFISRLYKEGLLDKEYLFNKTAQRNEKIASGKAFAFEDTAYQHKALTEALAKTNPQAKLSFLAPVEGKNGKKGTSMAPPVGGYTIIPKTAKYPLEAIDLYNTMLKDKELQMFINFGKEGVHYNKKDGKLVPIQPIYDSITYKIYYRLWYDAAIWMPNVVLGGFENGLNEYTKVGPHSIVFNIANYKPAFEVEATKGKALKDLKDEYLSKIITGAYPVTAVDEYLKKAEAAGQADVTKAAQDWFDKTGKSIHDKLAKK